MDEEMERLYNEAVKKYKRYKESWEVTKVLEKDWMRSKNKFERLDREQAEVDGRLKKVSGKKDKTKVEVEARDLTLDEIQRVAQTLGINLRKEE